MPSHKKLYLGILRHDSQRIHVGHAATAHTVCDVAVTPSLDTAYVIESSLPREILISQQNLAKDPF